MINYLVNNILNFFDNFHKKKIIQNLKSINKNKVFKTVFDVGGHKGESIDLFLNNFLILYFYTHSKLY